jgi:hypothetical protein
MSDHENLEDDFYEEYYNINTRSNVDALGDNELPVLSPKEASRPKSAFKQQFDYNEDYMNEDSMHKKYSQKDGVEKKRSSSKSKRPKSSDRKKRDERPRSSSRSSSKQKNDNDQESRSSSRIATGDTGYESLSQLSISSSVNSSSNLKLNNIGSNSTKFHHQPIIVSSTSSNSSTSNLFATGTVSSNIIANSIKPLSQQSSSISSLKQLKTNLLPLSGIKLPK